MHKKFCNFLEGLSVLIASNSLILLFAFWAIKPIGEIETLPGHFDGVIEELFVVSLALSLGCRFLGSVIWTKARIKFFFWPCIVASLMTGTIEIVYFFRTIFREESLLNIGTLLVQFGLTLGCLAFLAAACAMHYLRES